MTASPAETPASDGRTVLDDRDIARALTRIAHEILERNKGTGDLALVGIRSRGIHLADRIRHAMQEIEGGELKHLLKTALGDLLPQDILHRKKRGFGTPMGAWLKASLAPVLRGLLAPEVLQRRGLFDGGVEHLGDRAHLGRHAGCGDDRVAGALDDGRALEDHVAPITERGGAGQGGHVLQHGHALTRERGLLHAQRGGLHQPGVGADGVALGEHEQVAAHESRVRDPLQAAVA